MNESNRQIVHLLFGLGIAGFVSIFDRQVTVAVLVLALFLGFILSDALSRGYYVFFVSEIIERLERREAVPGKGALFFALGALFCLIFFPSGVAFIALVVLAVLDSTTTIAGVRYGKTKIYNNKSLEGSLIGIAATTAVLVFLLPLWMALVVAGVAGLVELFSPVDDNLTIPVATCLLLIALL
jgi:phytol kinase